MHDRKSRHVITLGALVALACNGVSETSEPDPPPGAIEVSISATGSLTDSATHSIVVTPVGQGDLPPQTLPYVGGTVLFPDLPAARYAVRVETPAATCWTLGLNPLLVYITGGETQRARFAVSCFGPPRVVLNRVSAGWATAERFILDEASRTLLLQILIGGTAIGEYPATVTAEGEHLLLDFDPTYHIWQATATRNGQCWAVEFNPDMLFDGFENGTYCSGGDG